MSDLNNNETRNLREIIAEALDLRGLTASNLAEAADIPVRYVSAFLDDDFSKLPPAPYVKGYLFKMAEVLKLDPAAIWEIYKKEVSVQAVKTIKISGAYDKLPSNRFAPKQPNKLAIWSAVIAIVLLAAVIFGFDSFFGTPELRVSSPSVNNFVASSPSIRISGRISNSRDKLTVNNEEILVSEDGSFEKDFTLQPGVNTIEFKVKRFLGKETSLVRQVIYQAQSQ